MMPTSYVSNISLLLLLLIMWLRAVVDVCRRASHATSTRNRLCPSTRTAATNSLGPAYVHAMHSLQHFIVIVIIRRWMVEATGSRDGLGPTDGCRRSSPGLAGRCRRRPPRSAPARAVARRNNNRRRRRGSRANRIVFTFNSSSRRDDRSS